MTFAGNWLFDTFNNPLTYSGHEGNFQGYVNTLTLPPGKTRSLLHFVVLGPTRQRADVSRRARGGRSHRDGLAAAPEIGDLTTAEICSIDNFNVAALTTHGFNYAACTPTHRNRQALDVAQAPVPEAEKAQTTVAVRRRREDDRPAARRHGVRRHDLAGDYARRISIGSQFYDQGQFGFNAYEIVATDAMEQAKAADAARSGGQDGTAAGHPDRDQEPVRHQRHADDQRQPDVRRIPPGARRLPGRQAARGRRGAHRQGGARGVRHERQLLQRRRGDRCGMRSTRRSRRSRRAAARPVAVAASLAAGALGSQTGDSLYGPASAASLVTLRGTDGLESGSGHHAAVVADRLRRRDGAFGRGPGRHAQRRRRDRSRRSGTSAPADAHPGGLAFGAGHPRAARASGSATSRRCGSIRSERPARPTPRRRRSSTSWTPARRSSRWASTVGGTDTPPAPPDATTGNTDQEGWMQYIDSHPELVTQGFSIFSAVDVSCSQKKIAYVRADPSACLRARRRRG